MFENMDQTLVDLQRLLAEQEEQVADTKKTINSLCRISGRQILFPDAERKSAAVVGQLNGDEYYGMALTTAVRTVLEARKAVGRGPATISDIYESMTAGGYQFGTPNPDHAKRGLREAIRKASHTFHKIPASGKIGLLDWYESIKSPKSNGVATNGHASTGTENGDADEDEVVAAVAAESPKKPR